MTDIDMVDRPPAGWFALNVMRKEKRKWHWVALMVDVSPDELKHSLCKIAFLYVQTITNLMEAAQRAKLGSSSPASTGTQRPLGMQSKTQSRPGCIDPGKT
jgi:hypothetical protein